MSDIGGKTAIAEKSEIQNEADYSAAPLKPTKEIMDLWGKVHGDMRQEFGEAIFRSWLKPLVLQAYYHGTMEVSVPTRFMRDWIQNHYAERILEMCQQENGDIKRLQIVVVQGAIIDDFDMNDDSTPIKKSSANENLIKEIEEISSPLDNRFKFENFVVGKPNALAHAAGRRVVETDAVPFNPLFIYGGVGLGKTHLMHAIAHNIKEQNPEKTVMYLSAEKFMYQFVRALRANETMNFKEVFRSVDVLMMDDIQFIAGKESTQEEFFHTFNALVDQNKQIIISADKSPSDLTGIDERLRSRLAWGLVADIHPTTYDLRLGILQSKRAQLEADVPDSVLEFLALKVTSNIREMEGALNRIVAHADVAKQEITLESTQESKL